MRSLLGNTHTGYYHGYAGCYYAFPDQQKVYLPLVKSSFHTTIFSDRQQTTIKQTFTNSTQAHIESCKYTFPIYEGVSVTSFTCEIADRKLIGVVKEKDEAKAEYDVAVSQGRQAGLLEQSSVSDVFSTSLGNLEVDQEVHVTITYIGELKNDLDSDNIRLTIPTFIAPRYGDLPEAFRGSNVISDRGMDISIDVIMPEEKPIQALESPSHSVSVSLGKISTDATDQAPSFSRASAVLSQTSSGLEKDFVFLIKAKDTGNPTAVLQTHSALPNHRSLMVSLVPKFSLPSIRPEIVFVADRSGSMRGNMRMLKQALTVFLKSIPSGVKFNICSFGSTYSFLWSKSQDYTKENLTIAIDHVQSFDANYGGTNTLYALQATIANRYTDIPLEIILLTDGDIWAQGDAFDAINKAVVDSKHQIRLFPLGIGNGVSHSLIEGLARAGNGFAQAVQHNERIDTRVIRMLKAAVTPHITNYTLEIKYDTEDDFELVEAVNDCLQLDGLDSNQEKQVGPIKSAISLFDDSADPDHMDIEDKAPSLPAIKIPKLLQAPQDIPSLYSFSRTTVYVLMSPDTIQRNPVSVVLKAESEHGPLKVEIPVTILDTPGEVVSQLAARKAVQDLEEQRGWIYHATNPEGKKLVELYPSRTAELVKQEAVRLGTTYGIANKWCSFVAVDADSKTTDDLPEGQATLDEDPEKTWEEKRLFMSQSASAYAAPAGDGLVTGRGSGMQGMRMQAKRRKAVLAQQAQMQQQQQQLGQMQPGQMQAVQQLQMQQQQQQQQQAAQTQQAGQMQQAMQMPRTFLSATAGDPSDSSLASFLRPQPQPLKASGGNPPRRQYTFSRSGARARYSLASSAHGIDRDNGAMNNVAEQPPPLPSKTPAEKVYALIVLQDFEGFWSASADVKGILDLADETAYARQAGNAWITALVVAFLEKRMSGEKEIWELVVEKAVEWLRANGGEDLIKEAEVLF